VKIDLGGIAKGFAVDLAVEAMRNAGCSSVLVNAGGDLRASGERSFAISCRLASGQIREMILQDCALAVSHRASDASPAEHQGYYLRVGSAECTPAACAAILAPTAALADALTKCALLCSDEHCDDILRHFNASRFI
jgi:thiamine biosynthesis lipoprotein